MRFAAILFIVASLGVNFVYNNLSSLVLAMFAFPVLLMLLLKKNKRKPHHSKKPQAGQPEKTDLPTITGS